MTSHAHVYKNLISQQKMPLMVDRVIWKMRTDNDIGRSVAIHDQLVDGVALVLHFPQDLTQHVTLNTR